MNKIIQVNISELRKGQIKKLSRVYTEKQKKELYNYYIDNKYYKTLGELIAKGFFAKAHYQKNRGIKQKIQLKKWQSTQRCLAERLGISEQYLSLILSGKRKCPDKMQKKIDSHLNNY